MAALFHGTCVSIGNAAALLRGAPGTGKSDLALRFLHMPPLEHNHRHLLVADDQVQLTRNGQRITAGCPAPLKGLIEVRGAGIIQINAHVAHAELRLVFDLVAPEDVHRWPVDMQEEILGVQLSRVMLAPFEASASLKLALHIQKILRDSVD